MRFGTGCGAWQGERPDLIVHAKTQDHQRRENRRLHIDIGGFMASILPLDAQTAVSAEQQSDNVAAAQASRKPMGTANDDGDGQLHCPALTPA